MFCFEVPGEAVGRKVAVAVPLMKEGISRLRRLTNDIEVELRSTDDVSRAVIIGDNLLGIVVEGIGVQRHSVVEESQSSANNGRVGAGGSPREAPARSYPGGIGERLSFDTDACICCQMPVDDPVVLGISSRLEIGERERAAAGVSDGLQQIAGGVHNIHVSVEDLA